jgi:uncharacterized protein YxjI
MRRVYVARRCENMSMLETREFIINEKLLSVRNTYVIKNRQQQELGFAKRELVSLGPHYWFEDNSGTRLGEVKGKVISLTSEYEIKDRTGQTVAKAKRKMLKLIGSEWKMEDPHGNEIAKIEGNITHHAYKMVAPDKSTIAEIHLKWVTIKDEYGVEITKPDFSPLLVLGFTIAVEEAEHYEEKKSAPKRAI